jgi:DNA-binding MarR family transcriptional regulator
MSNLKTKGLDQARKMIVEFRKLDDVMPTQAAEMFLLIALEPGKRVSVYGEELGVAQSTASRNVQYLSDLHWKKRPGLGLVETTPDTFDARMKLVRLTAKGRRVAQALVDIMD